MIKIIPNLYQKLSVARKVTWAAYVLLAMVLLANGLLGDTPNSLLVFTMVPLLIFIPGLRSEHYKALSLLCFVTLMYFMVTVSNLFSPKANWLDWLELLLLVVLFCATMMFSRWKQYSLYQDDSHG